MFYSKKRMMGTQLTQRFWEVDMLRGIGICMMVVSNTITDLKFFHGGYAFLQSDFWDYFAVTTATVFISLVGVSLTLSYSRATQRTPGKSFWRKYLTRGLKIFSWGLIITAVTWVFLGDHYIRFGVLHLIGTSIILAYPVIHRRFTNLLLAFAVIGVGFYLTTVTVEGPWLLWIGFRPQQFVTVDYFPLLPWFGAVLIGLAVGNTLYPHYTRRFSLPDLSHHRFIRLLSFLGKKSLQIYLLHQPVIVTILYVFGIIRVGFL